MTNKLLKSFVVEVAKDVLDKALSKSDDRRGKFLKQWQDENPPKDAVRETMIKKVRKTFLSEAPTPPATDPNATPAPTTPDAGTAPPTDPTATTAPGGDIAPPPTDPNAPVDPNAPPGATGGGVDPTTGAPLDPNAPPTDATGGADLGGGGFGGGGGGFGGGAGPTDDTGTPPAGGEGGDEAGNGGEESEEGGDPITKAVDDAKSLLDQTRDIPTILKSMKQMIQDKFEKPDHALGLVKALYDTQDPTLRSVAVRLYQFIKVS